MSRASTTSIGRATFQWASILRPRGLHQPRSNAAIPRGRDRFYHQAALVGYPKLDRLASGGYDSAGCRAALGLDSARPTAVYAPTYSEGSSLHLAGEDIVRALAAEGFNVVVKLHDRSLDSNPRYNAGVDWRRRFEQLEIPGRILYLETSDASPALAAADIMVTDHSSIGFGTSCSTGPSSSSMLRS